MKSTIISLQITILICFSALSLAFAGYGFFPGKGSGFLINDIEDPDTDNPGVIVIDNDISLIHLHDSAYMHVTWDESELYGRFSSNGMIFVKNGKALMIDTPMDNEKTRRLCEYLENSMNVEVVRLVIGHYHDDCMGGLEYIQNSGIILKPEKPGSGFQKSD
ncbi:MAG: hypothetical protein ACFCUM_14930 [Bacteroidales bacterium]